MRLNLSRSAQSAQELAYQAIDEVAVSGDKEAVIGILRPAISGRHGARTARQLDRILAGIHANASMYCRSVLDALVNGADVPPVPISVADESRLRSLPVEIAFEELKTVVPGLELLEDDVRRGAVSTTSRWMGPGGPVARAERKLPSAERAHSEEVRGQYAVVAGLRDRLQSLVGPTSDSSDPIVRSIVARSIAFNHLAKIGGLAPNIDDE